MWPFLKRTSQPLQSEDWIAIAQCETHIARLFESNLRRKNRTVRRFATLQELIQCEGRKPSAVLVDAEGSELLEIERQLKSLSGWEYVKVLSLSCKAADDDPFDWHDLNPPGCAAIVTPFDR